MRRLMLEMQHILASPARNPRMSTVLGRLLGLAFLICFGTGLFSHFLQEPEPWMRFPTEPYWLYAFTQGTHITAGIVCFPLLLGKLWTVYPDLFQTPPIRSFAQFLERASIAIFVGASLLEITIGLLNTYQFVPFPFFFRETHFALSFVVIGSLAIHIAVKLPIIARYWRKRDADGSPHFGELEAYRAQTSESGSMSESMPRPAPVPPPVRTPGGITGRIMAYIDSAPAPEPRVSRRGFLATIGASALAIVGLTAGQSFAILDPFNLFAPRKRGIGPQNLPVNRSAEDAGVFEAALDPNWVLTLTNGDRTMSFSREQLLAMPQVDVELPIACVEGWSQLAHWRGVRMRDLADAVGADPNSRFVVRSLEERGSFRITQMGPEYARDESTLVALELNGETLDIEHGYPARMIAPARPGVTQTKWLSSLEVA